MSSEPFTTTSAPVTEASERGLLIAMLLLVVLGVGAMFLIS